jgi:uncharacterized protein
MFGTLNNDAIDSILHHQLIGHIGCHSKGTTYVVPVSYAYHDGCIYIRSEKEGMKIDMMRQNPNVCFEVYRMQDMGNWQCVVAWGTFEELTDEKERAAAIRVLLKRDLPIITSQTVRLTPNFPFDDVNSVTGIIFRIKLERKTGRYEINEEIKY